jgi:hypothetical protein
MLVDKNIEDDVPFKGEGIVTPCFPQLVNIYIWTGQELCQTHKYDYVM